MELASANMAAEPAQELARVDSICLSLIEVLSRDSSVLSPVLSFFCRLLDFSIDNRSWSVHSSFTIHEAYLDF